MQKRLSDDTRAREPEVSGFDHPFTQLLFFLIVFWIPFYRWRHISEQYDFLRVDWILVVFLFAIIGPFILVRRRFPQRLKSNLNLLLLFFFLINLAASLLSPYAAASIAGVQKLILGYVLIALALLFIGPKGYQRTFPVVLCTAVALGALMAVAGYYLQIEILTKGETLGESQSARRGAGGSIGANNSALLCIFCLPFLVHWLHYGRSRLSRGWAMAQIVILLLGIVSSYSRGGFLMFLFVCGLLLLEERRRFHPRLLGPVMAAVCAIFIVAAIAVPDTFIERMQSLSKGTQGDMAMSRRAAYLQVGWEVFAQYPLIGTGIETFQEHWLHSETAKRYTVPVERRYAHNTYIEVLVGCGAIGLLVFLAILLRAFSNFQKAIALHRARGEDRLASLATSYKIAFICIISYLLILSSIEHKLFLLALASSQLCLRMATAGKLEAVSQESLYDVSEAAWIGDTSPETSATDALSMPEAEGLPAAVRTTGGRS